MVGSHQGKKIAGTKAERGSDTPWAPEWHKGKAGLSYAFIENNQSYIKRRVDLPGVVRMMGILTAAAGMDPGEAGKIQDFLINAGTRWLLLMSWNSVTPLEVGRNPR